MASRSKKVKRSTVLDKLDELDDHAFEILAVLTLANEELSAREWGQACKSVGLRTKNAGHRRKTLVAERLVVELESRFGSNCFVVSPAVAMPVLTRLQTSKQLAALVPRRVSRSSPIARLGTALRLALLDGDRELAAEHLDQALGWGHAIRNFPAWLLETLGVVEDGRATLAVLGEAAMLDYFDELARATLLGFVPVGDELLDLALELGDKRLRLRYGRVLTLRGRGEEARALDRLPKYGREGLALLAAFWAGDYAGAAALGDEVVGAMRRKRKCLPELEGVCHVLAGFTTCAAQPARLAALEPVIEALGQGKSECGKNTVTLAAIWQGLGSGDTNLRRRLGHWYTPADWIELWIDGLHDLWLAPDDSRGPEGRQARTRAKLEDWAAQAGVFGYGPVARELGAVATAMSDGLVADEGASLVHSFRPPKRWEAALAGLDALAHRAQGQGQDSGGAHLVWELRSHGGWPELTPRLRTSAKSRKGRVVALARLLAGEVECVSEADRRVIAAAEPEPVDWGLPKMGLGARAALALIGHPRVVDARGEPLAVERGQAKLRTRARRGQIRVVLEPPALLDQPIVCTIEEGGERALVYERSAALARIGEVLARSGGLQVPAAESERLRATLARLSVAAEIEVEGDLVPEAAQVEADPRPVLVLEWDGAALGVQGRVAPLGLAGSYLRPGVGHRRCSAELREAQTQTLRLHHCERDLDEERRRFDELEARCPTLMAYARGPFEWHIGVLEDALEVTSELEALADAVVLAWPKGRVLAPPQPRELSDLDLEITSGQAWLELAGGLRIDEGTVLGFRELIEARAGPRFVALDGDRFIKLSEDLRRRVDLLANIAQPGKGKGKGKGKALQTSVAMLPVLGELAEDLDEPRFDAAARAKLDRIRELGQTRPRKPRGLKAELRDYQREGYAWMWRLAEVGLGACLADDMGLGKTVQALALLRQRAAKGPALVVCPTSVVHNWVAEAARFTPGLKAAVLGDADDRAALLAKAGPRQLIVCSYGLLTSEAEALTGVCFATLVVDEAHALKNDRTKRAKVARELQAEFRLGLTGTPVENRVAELWSLFRVLVPGLLGTKAKFEDRFAKPIARGDRERARQLRALLGHFILRRTKAQVLDELPPRTEITVKVTPGAKERAYYEALRQRARDQVEADPRKKRFRILAEITRLRQAAVDPRLVDPELGPAGAKLDVLLDHVLALREEGHRALIFTQFLTSMAMICARLEAAGVEHFTLDGSTPAAERARRVEAFQDGQRDVFVLSLRAGGVGMNLTGADYVLHVDPWWNPAVEDQATDRAHRMGQTRAVTVYRLVTTGTIEEKILALHQQKRELADDILAGMEGAGALDVDELMALMEE